MRALQFLTPAMAVLFTSSISLADPPPIPAPPGPPAAPLPPGVVPVAAPPAPVSPQAPLPAAPVAGSPPAAPAAPPAPPPAEEKKHGSRLPGVLTLVLGGAGLGAGAIFGALATAKGASVRSNCVANVCPASQAGPIAETKSFQDASYAAFIAGGVIAAAGLALTIVAPGDPEKSARLAPWVAPPTGVASRGPAAGVSLVGSF